MVIENRKRIHKTFSSASRREFNKQTQPSQATNISISEHNNFCMQKPFSFSKNVIIEFIKKYELKSTKLCRFLGVITP